MTPWGLKYAQRLGHNGPGKIMAPCGQRQKGSDTSISSSLSLADIKQHILLNQNALNNFLTENEILWYNHVTLWSVESIRFCWLDARLVVNSFGNSNQTVKLSTRRYFSALVCFSHCLGNEEILMTFEFGRKKVSGWDFVNVHRWWNLIHFQMCLLRLSEIVSVAGKIEFEKVLNSTYLITKVPLYTQNGF